MIWLNLFWMADRGLDHRMLCCAMRQLNQWAKLGHYASNLQFTWVRKLCQHCPVNLFSAAMQGIVPIHPFTAQSQRSLWWEEPSFVNFFSLAHKILLYARCLRSVVKLSCATCRRGMSSVLFWKLYCKHGQSPVEMYPATAYCLGPPQQAPDLHLLGLHPRGWVLDLVG